MKAPDGTPIVATDDIIPGEARVSWNEIDGTFEYVGETDIFWDDQTTRTIAGQAVFVDDNGNEWLESQLIPDDAFPMDQIQPWYHNRELRRIEIVNTVESLMQRITGKKIEVSSCQYLQRAVVLLLNRSEPEE